ncbi:MAG: oligosaccharide flippase family protein [Candidatus Zhuqueibacterota bacterium]
MIGREVIRKSTIPSKSTIYAGWKLSMIHLMLDKLLKKMEVSYKFFSDLSWNVISFGVMGVTGILLNIIIAKMYNTEILGVFNQLYAIYILLSQLAVAGIHLSILKNVSQYSEKPDGNIREIFSSAIYLVGLLSVLVILSAFFSHSLWIDIFKSSGVKTGFIYMLPGLFFFSINKTYLAYHNAYRRMKAYAVFQSLRYILLMIFLILFIILLVDGNKVVAIFTLSEIVLSVILLLYSLKYIKFSVSRKVIFWAKEHLRFGTRAIVGYVLADVNTRIDVLMLGVFASDKIVGIYSFAAILADGFNQLPIIIRTNVNPIITRYRFSKSIAELENAISRGKKLTYKFLIPIGILALLSYPLILYIFRFRTEFSILFNSWGIFSILIAGCMISAGYLPFQMILSQIGCPGKHTKYLTLFFLTNLILNVILISILGMYGAAVATALAFISQVFYLKYFVKSAIKLKI